MGVVLQVNTGARQVFVVGGRLVETAIVKTAVDGPIRIADDHVGDDVQADRRHHGGRDKAVYAYDRASYDAWAAQRGHDLPNGFFGDNLTLSGVDVDGARIGERWQVGDEVVLEVTSPRIPCETLAWRLQDDVVSTFLHADRPGAYLRIVTPGEVTAGDPVEVVRATDHDVTMTDVLALWRGDDNAAHVLTAGDVLPDETRARATARLAR